MGIWSQLRNRNRFVSELNGQGRKGFALVCAASLLAHFLLFLSVFWLHDFELTKPKARVVRVDLVSFVPGPVGGPEASEDLPLKTPKSDTGTVSLDTKPVKAKLKHPKPITVLKPDVSLKAKPKNLKQLMAAKEKPKAKKKKTKKPKTKVNQKKELQKAREALAEKIEDQNQEQIADALKRMQAAIREKEEAVNSEGLGAGAGQGTGIGKQGSDPLLLYQTVLKSIISQNWVFNDIMARMNQNLEVEVLIKILKSGEIRDVTFMTKSGNQYLDESAKKAIKRSNPLPELPKGMPDYDLIVNFTPKGLK